MTILLLSVTLAACGADENNGDPASNDDNINNGIASGLDCERASVGELAPFDASEYLVFDFEVPEQFVLQDPESFEVVSNNILYELDLEDAQAPEQMEIQIRHAPAADDDPQDEIDSQIAGGAETLETFTYDGEEVTYYGVSEAGRASGFFYLPWEASFVRIDVEFLDASGECPEELDAVVEAVLGSIVPNEESYFPDLPSDN